jgi:DNA-binding transcriptional regulator YhcF (GntR family)
MKLTSEKLKQLIKEEMEEMQIPDDAHAGFIEHDLRSALKAAKDEGMSLELIMTIVHEIFGE